MTASAIAGRRTGPASQAPQPGQVHTARSLQTGWRIRVHVARNTRACPERGEACADPTHPPELAALVRPCQAAVGATLSYSDCRTGRFSP